MSLWYRQVDIYDWNGFMDWNCAKSCTIHQWCWVDLPTICPPPPPKWFPTMLLLAADQQPGTDV